MLGLPMISSTYLHLGCFSLHLLLSLVQLAVIISCFVDVAFPLQCGLAPLCGLEQTALVEQATAQSYASACQKI
jgi:hypothetical protein